MRKRVFILFVPLFTVLPFTAAFASDAITAFDNSVEISAQRTRLNYGETDSTGTYFDSERGNPKGVRVALTGLNEARDGGMYSQLVYSHVSGDVNYTGALQVLNGGNVTYVPITAISGATIDDYHVKLGARIGSSRNHAAIPYLAFGGHRWERAVGKDQSGGYTETYTHGYAMLGGLWQQTITPRTILTVNLAGGKTLNPTMSTLDVNFRLGSATIWEAGIDIDQLITQRWHVFAAFDYTRYKYGKSEVEPSYVLGYYVLEPDSKTELVSYNVGLRYSY